MNFRQLACFLFFNHTSALNFPLTFAVLYILLIIDLIRAHILVFERAKPALGHEPGRMEPVYPEPACPELIEVVEGPKG